MSDKVTIKDIAREAGVSIATVSYVLNNRDDKRISEETKKKVLQIVNLFNYTCNFSAKFISSGKSNIVALYAGDACFELNKAEKFDFICTLSSVLHSHGFSLRLIDNSDLSKLDNVDAIICYDTADSFFHTVGENNYVPLIAMDAFINQWLFYQINTDYSKLNIKASEHFARSFATVSLSVNNNESQNRIKAVFPEVVFVNDFKTLNDFCLNNADKPVLTLSAGLLRYLKEFVKETVYFDFFQAKAEKLIDCIKLAVGREQADHDILI